jgi:uncharacterized protein DUF4160
VPRLIEFEGVQIVMYTNDHWPPHFHAICGDDGAKIEVFTGKVRAGNLPPATMKRVQDWRKKRIWDLSKAWTRIRLGRSPRNIRPP